MIKLKQVYKCEVCGNIVEVLHTGAGELVCCGQPMKLKEANTVDAATEKHVPVIEKTDKGIVVKVGSVDHPMENEHYIEWIEATLKSGQTMRKFLKPGEKPEMLVCECSEEKCCCEVEQAREYCNLHGLWGSIKN
jgi:superoxide reductase